MKYACGDVVVMSSSILIKDDKIFKDIISAAGTSWLSLVIRLLIIEHIGLVNIDYQP